jgi:hypothetical protein
MRFTVYQIFEVAFDVLEAGFRFVFKYLSDFHAELGLVASVCLYNEVGAVVRFDFGEVVGVINGIEDHSFDLLFGDSWSGHARHLP